MVKRARNLYGERLEGIDGPELDSDVKREIETYIDSKKDDWNSKE